MQSSWAMITYLVLLVLQHGSAQTQSKEEKNLLKKFMSYVNNMRHQIGIAGVRELYWDDDLAKEAKQRAMDCDASRYTSGDTGSFVLNVEDPGDAILKIINSAHYRDITRKTYDRRTGQCRSGSDEVNCATVLQLFTPKAYLIGCGANFECEPNGMVACSMNRRNTENVPVRQNKMACPVCTESFTCDASARTKVCVLKDPSMQKNLPEDSIELTSTKQAKPASFGTDGGTTDSPDSPENSASLLTFRYLLVMPLALLEVFRYF